jgi:CheY-like chemotaxis protein
MMRLKGDRPCNAGAWTIMNSPPVAAVFNTSPDTVDMLRFVLERAGFVVVSAFTWELRDNQVDAAAFIAEHQPDVIVYDIAPPYEANWRLLQHVQSTLPIDPKRYVLTTTNVRQVQKIAGEQQELFEIIGKPYDLAQVVGAAQRAASGG